MNGDDKTSAETQAEILMDEIRNEQLIDFHFGPEELMRRHWEKVAEVMGPVEAVEFKRKCEQELLAGRQCEAREPDRDDFDGPEIG